MSRTVKPVLSGHPRGMLQCPLRDCSLFMPKRGSVIFKQLRHMKNLPFPGSGYFKKLPPPPPSGRDVPPIAKLRTTRVLAGCQGEESLGALCFVKNYLCSTMMRLSPVLKDLIQQHQEQQKAAVVAAAVIAAAQVCRSRSPYPQK